MALAYATYGGTYALPQSQLQTPSMGTRVASARHTASHTSQGHSQSKAQSAPSYDPTRIQPADLAETTNEIHAAFARAPSVQYALCGIYALTLFGWPRQPSSVECIVSQGKFGIVKRMLGSSRWWHPSVATGAMVSFYTSTSGTVVRVAWFEAGVVGPRNILLAEGTASTAMHTSAGLCVLTGTQLLRAALKKFAGTRADEDGEVVRWLAGNARALAIDVPMATYGLYEEMIVVMNEMPAIRCILLA